MEKILNRHNCTLTKTKGIIDITQPKQTLNPSQNPDAKQPLASGPSAFYNPAF